MIEFAPNPVIIEKIRERVWEAFDTMYKDIRTTKFHEVAIMYEALKPFIYEAAEDIPDECGDYYFGIDEFNRPQYMMDLSFKLLYGIYQVIFCLDDRRTFEFRNVLFMAQPKNKPLHNGRKRVNPNKIPVWSSYEGYKGLLFHIISRERRKLIDYVPKSKRVKQENGQTIAS